MWIAFLIWTAVALVLVWIGIRTWRSEKAAGFFSGVEAPKVSDVKKYNHAVAILWFVYAALFEVIGTPLLSMKQNPTAFVGIVLGIVVSSIALMIEYNKILSRYQQDPLPERRREVITFDPERQTAMIRSSICTGEKVAGFKDKETGHFTEVMLIRSPEDEQRFKDEYHLDEVKTEY